MSDIQKKFSKSFSKCNTQNMVLIGQSSFPGLPTRVQMRGGRRKDTEKRNFFSLLLMLSREGNKYLDTKMVLWSYYALRVQK